MMSAGRDLIFSWQPSHDLCRSTAWSALALWAKAKAISASTPSPFCTSLAADQLFAANCALVFLAPNCSNLLLMQVLNCLCKAQSRFFLV